MSSDAHPGAASAAPPDDNERLVVRIFLGLLAGKGWIEATDDEENDQLVAALRRPYRANPLCQQKVEFNGELLHDLLAARPGEYLAAAWEQQRQDRWEREEAERWDCPCGHTFGLYPFGHKRARFYTRARRPRPLPRGGQALPDLRTGARRRA